MEMIMDKSRWVMWNFSLSGVMEELIYVRKPWNSKQIHKKIMHLYELCMQEAMKGHVINYELM